MNAKQLDFFVIGAMKAGTTSLHHYLRSHPMLYLPAEKEVPFFALDEYFTRGLEWYRRECFSKAGPTQLRGTVSPLYMADPRVPERMYRLCPDAKLIALLRDPIARARSHHRMAVRAFGELRTFEEAISGQLEQSELERLRAPPEFAAGTGRAADYGSARKYRDAYVVRGEYGRILGDFLAHYPRERLLILYSRDLEEDPGGTLAAIHRFLGVVEHPLPNRPRRYHVGAEAGARPLSRWVARLVHSPATWLRPLARTALPASYRRRLKLWSVMNRTTSVPVRETCEPLRFETAARLASHYLQDEEMLAGMVAAAVPWKTRLAELASGAPGDRP